REFSRLFGVSDLKGGSLSASSTHKNPSKIRTFGSSDFLRDGFLSYQVTKRSKSCRIYEYFNEEMAEIRP
ncbi:MAG: hypothetical protein IJC79_07680, partial [Clostridia bacterium]|nr:hypothetical protein [Clostridia bacterium]